MKICSRCQVEKSVSEFHTDKRSGRPRSYCKQCQLEVNKAYREKNQDKVREQNKEYQLRHKLKTRYNLSEEEYARAVAQANGICSICLKDKKLFIDHCHMTGEFRGLICSQCNTALGMFADDIESLRRAIQYLAP